MSTTQKPIQENGIVPTTINTIYTPIYGVKAIFSNIRFNNDGNTGYTLAVYYKTSDTSQPFLLYRFDLDEGDVLNDDTNYELPFGAYLVAWSNVDTVNYLINGYLETVVST